MSVSAADGDGDISPVRILFVFAFSDFVKMPLKLHLL